MKVIKLTLGDLQSNTYIIKKANNVLIVDPGAQANKIIAEINSNEKVVAILLTHGHFDHIGALNDIYKKYPVKVYAHKSEEALINDPNKSYYLKTITTPITYIESDIEIANFNIKVHHTPGHTKGSVIFEIDNLLFSGDTLFKGSIGRMDLATGNQYDMHKTLNYLKTLTKNYTVYPGHGDFTTLFDEFSFNPYFK